MNNFIFQNFFIFEYYQLVIHKVTNIYKLLLKIIYFLFYRIKVVEVMWFFYFLLYFLLLSQKQENKKTYTFFILLGKPFFDYSFFFYPIKLVKFTLLRSAFVHKTTREQFEYLTRTIFLKFFLNFDSVWLNNYFFFTRNFFMFNKKKISYINIFIFKKEI